MSNAKNVFFYYNIFCFKSQVAAALSGKRYNALAGINYLKNLLNQLSIPGPRISAPARGALS